MPMLPKRESERRRRNADVIPAEHIGSESDEVIVPPANPMWPHPVIEWYEALQAAPQRVYYVATDWATARMAAEMLARELDRPGPVSGTVWAGFAKVCEMLLCTEGSRRRARIETARAQQVMPNAAEVAEAGAVDMAAWRERFSG